MEQLKVVSERVYYVSILDDNDETLIETKEEEYLEAYHLFDKLADNINFGSIVLSSLDYNYDGKYLGSTMWEKATKDGRVEFDN